MRVTRILTCAVSVCMCLDGCTPAAPSAKSAAAPPSGHESSSAEYVDTSSELAFTNSVLGMVLKRDPKGGWSSRGTLQLSGGELVVNLGRLWMLCHNAPAQCAAEVAHFVDEVIAVSGQPRSAPATAQQLLALIRPAD
jgi:hypothetical protein